MWSLPVCDFELQLWRLSPTGRRRLLVLLASRVPEEVVSRTCVVCPSCLRPPFSITLIFRPVRACLKVTVAS